jgi:hypothetical protein
MPTSAWDGRRWVTDRFAESKATTVIDIGPGEGTYSTLGRHLIWWAQWIGVEIFEPYVDRFLLGDKYDQIVVQDARTWRPLMEDYLILFGDVLEHMPYQDAVNLLEFHKALATEIYVSVPIVDSPQGACFGNDHETHVHQWSFEEMCDLLPGAETFKGVQVGRWWWRRG